MADVLSFENGQSAPGAAVPTTTGLPELMSAAQAARFLGIGAERFLVALRAGQLPLTPFLIGARVKVSRREIEAWLEGRLDQPADADVDAAGGVRRYRAERSRSSGPF